jgi:glycosyltransferase involved in cell wall biosynthesis
MAANKGVLRRSLNYLSYLVSALAFSLFVPKPDVVIGTSPHLFCAWAGLIFSKLRRTPFVLEVRDIWPDSLQAVGALSSKRIIRFLEWLEKRAYADADHIVTVGVGYRRHLIEKRVPAAKISVVPNGVDQERFRPQSKEAALVERYGLEGKFVCSYVGTIGMACGLDVVVRAAKLLKTEQRNDIVFLLVGDGAVRVELEGDVRRMNLQNVIFMGRQDKDAVPAIIASSDVCLVHLKKAELFTSILPSKIFEAGGMSRPVILGVEGDAADLVRAAGMGVTIEPENEFELVAALKKLSMCPELAEKWGKAGHEYVTTNFDRDRLAQEYVGVLKQLANGEEVTA